MTAGKHFQPDQLRRFGKKILTGYTERQIAREEKISNSTAHTIKVRLAAGGIDSLAGLDAASDGELARIIYCKEAAVVTHADAMASSIVIKRGISSNPLVLKPDFEAIANRILDARVQKINEFTDYVDLCRSKGMMAMSRSTFYRRVDEAVGRLSPGAGEKDTYLAQAHGWGLELQIDYLGGKFRITDPGGKPRDLIVCEFCWAASNYACAQFIEAATTRETAGALLNALKFYRRRPALLVCDNAWSMVERHEYGSEAIINQSMQHLLSRLGIQIDPATVFAPQVKSAVEYSGRLIRERCLKRMREGAVMSVAEASEKLQGLIDRYINSKGFRNGGRGTPRKAPCDRYESPAAMPLPEILPEYAEFYPHLTATRAYRVKAGGWTLSVPYTSARRKVSVEITTSEAKVWSDDDGSLLATHLLSKAGPDRVLVDDSHMPPGHRAIKARERKYKDEDGILEAAGGLCGDAKALCQGILRRSGFLQGRKACIAIIGIGRRQAGLGRLGEFGEACKDVRAGDPRNWNSYAVRDALDMILQEEARSADGSYQKQSDLPLPDGTEAPQPSADAPAKKYTCMIGSRGGNGSSGGNDGKGGLE